MSDPLERMRQQERPSASWEGLSVCLSVCLSVAKTSPIAIGILKAQPKAHLGRTKAEGELLSAESFFCVSLQRPHEPHACHLSAYLCDKIVSCQEKEELVTLGLRVSTHRRAEHSGQLPFEKS